MALRTSPHLVMIGRDKEGPLAGAAGTGLCVAVCLACCVYGVCEAENVEYGIESRANLLPKSAIHTTINVGRHFVFR